MKSWQHIADFSSSNLIFVKIYNPPYILAPSGIEKGDMNFIDLF